MNEPKSKIRGRDLAQGRSQDSGICQVILNQEKPFEWIIHFDRKCAIVLSSTADVSFTSSRLPIRHRGDPSESEPVLRRIEQENVTLTAILNTHHHRDHTGGNEGLLAGNKLEVYGHKSDQGRIPGLTRGVEEGDDITVGELRGKVLFIPGHTTGHVAYLFDNNLFCGDTLFTAGCGRLFEGTAEQMQASLKKLMALPDETKVYCGHEYTESNLRFAMIFEPKNHKLVSRLETVQALRARGLSTGTSTLEPRQQTNPFLRWDSKEIQASVKSTKSDARLDPVSVFAAVRKMKDAF